MKFIPKKGEQTSRSKRKQQQTIPVRRGNIRGSTKTDDNNKNNKQKKVLGSIVLIVILIGIVSIFHPRNLDVSLTSQTIEKIPQHTINEVGDNEELIDQEKEEEEEEENFDIVSQGFESPHGNVYEAESNQSSQSFVAVASNPTTNTETTTTTTKFRTISECFPYNSKAWLSSRCFTNIIDRYHDHDHDHDNPAVIGSNFILPPKNILVGTFNDKKKIQNGTANDSTENFTNDADVDDDISWKKSSSLFLRDVLSQSMCDESSSFVNPSLIRPSYAIHNETYYTNKLWKLQNITTMSDIEKEEILIHLEWERHWTYRILFTGIYLHQHQPAFDEMKYRHRHHHDRDRDRSRQSHENNHHVSNNVTRRNKRTLLTRNTSSSKQKRRRRRLLVENQPQQSSILMDECNAGNRIENTVDDDGDVPSPIGINDYECPDAKYLVTWLVNSGMGASVRLGLVPTLLAGIAMNRTVVVMNTIPVGDKISKDDISVAEYLTKPWQLASTNCYDDNLFANDHRTTKHSSSSSTTNTSAATTNLAGRRDYQCYFLPISPCIPSIQDLKEAVVYSNVRETLHIQQYASFPQKKKGSNINTNSGQEEENVANNAKVVIIKGASMMGILDQRYGRRLVASRIKQLIEQYVIEKSDDKKEEEAAEDNEEVKYKPDQPIPMDILAELGRWRNKLDYEPFERHQGIHYNQGYSLLHGAALLYILRPNALFRKNVDTLVDESLSNTNGSNGDDDNKDSNEDNKRDHRVNSTVYGMPIRASDKCKSESVCLLFDEYMDLIMQQHNKYGSDLQRKEQQQRQKDVVDVILTSESSHIMAQRHAWERSHIMDLLFSNPTNVSQTNHNDDNNNVPNTNNSSISSSSTPSFRFIVNQRDILQGTGSPPSYGSDAYEIMVNSIANIKLQLHSQHLVGNCCSSYHILMMDLIKTGCGGGSSRSHHRHDDTDSATTTIASPRQSSFHCMQELDDSKFHLCCAWSDKSYCKEQKENYKQRIKQLGLDAFQ